MEGRRREKEERVEWIGELEQRKLITRPVAFSWLDYLAGRVENARRLVRSVNAKERERSFAKAMFDFARLNGLVKSDLTGYLTEQEKVELRHEYMNIMICTRSIYT